MSIFKDSKDVSLPFNCPTCGKAIDVGDDIKYCDHVEFVWGWGDPDFWIFAKLNFRKEYINHLKEKVGNCENDDNEIEEEIIKSFITESIVPFDDVSTAIPFNERIIEEFAGVNGIFVYEDSHYYSGVVIGIKRSHDFTQEM